MTCEDHNLSRMELEFDDGDDGRLYYCTHDGCDRVVPSVTTVINRRDDPDKDRAIKYWRRNNDGSDGSADHEHLLHYSGWRGTIFHFQVLSLLDPTLSATAEEHGALRNVKDHSADYPWVYSVLYNRAKKRGDVDWFNETFPTQSEYDGRMEVTLRNAFADDVAWATKQFFNNTKELGLAAVNYDESECDDLQNYVSEHVRTENITAVEEYIPTDDGYSGQFDLVYEKPSGETVLLDLKNSSGIRWSHQCQLAAYANAIEAHGTSSDTVSTESGQDSTQRESPSRTAEGNPQHSEDSRSESNNNSVHTPIDRLCVFRAHSDSQAVELQWESEFTQSRSSFMDDFNCLKNRVTKLVNQMDTAVASV